MTRPIPFLLLTLALTAAGVDVCAAPGEYDVGPASPEVLQTMDTPMVDIVLTPITQLPFNTAVRVSVSNSRMQTVSPERAARGAASTVAVYRSLINDAALDPNAATPPAQLQNPAAVDFTVARESVYGWALMSQTGNPAIKLELNGKTSGHASASWSVGYAVPGKGKRNVYLRFRLPDMGFDGRFEQGASGPMRARLRAELLVNGYPVWSHETMRVSSAGSAAQSGSVSETHAWLEQFGQPLAYDASAESAPASTINWKIGSFDAGQVLDITMVHFVEAAVDPSCQLKNDMYACSGMVVNFKRESSNHPARFYSYPAN